MVLCIVLALIMLVPSVPVRAAGIKYYYDKYNIGTSYNEGPQIFEGYLEGSYVGGGVTILPEFASGYPSYNFNSVTGKFTTAGVWNEYQAGLGQNRWAYRVIDDKLYMYNSFGDWSNISKYTKTALPYEVRGILVQANIVAIDGTYPVNGKHTDGYWYVKKGVVNNNPTITINQPNENLYFSKLKMA